MVFDVGAIRCVFSFGASNSIGAVNVAVELNPTKKGNPLRFPFLIVQKNILS